MERASVTASTLGCLSEPVVAYHGPGRVKIATTVGQEHQHAPQQYGDGVPPPHQDPRSTRHQGPRQEAGGHR